MSHVEWDSIFILILLISFEFMFYMMMAYHILPSLAMAALIPPLLPHHLQLSGRLQLRWLELRHRWSGRWHGRAAPPAQQPDFLQEAISEVLRWPPHYRLLKYACSFTFYTSPSTLSQTMSYYTRLYTIIIPAKQVINIWQLSNQK